MDSVKLYELVKAADELGDLIDRDVEIETCDADPDYIVVDVIWEDFHDAYDNFEDCYNALRNMICGIRLYKQCREEE